MNKTIQWINEMAGIFCDVYELVICLPVCYIYMHAQVRSCHRSGRKMTLSTPELHCASCVTLIPYWN